MGPLPAQTTPPSPPLSHSLTIRPSPSPTRIFLRSQFRTTPLRNPPVSLAHRTALITGASSGLGYHAARHLLSLSLSRLILAVRSTAKGEAAAAKLRAAFPRAVVEVWEVEMGDYESIVGFVRRVEGEFGNTAEGEDGGKRRLDIVILNAGLAGSEFVRNAKTEHCEVVQVNYLGTMLLAVLLMPVLRDRTGERAGRLTIVGSGGVFQAKLPNRGARPFLKSFDDLAVQPWDALERYYSSKVLGMLFFVRLLEYLPPAEELVVNMVDPGLCKGTELHRESKGVMGAVLSAVKALTGRSLEDGAWAYVDAAVVKGKESHGCFVMDWKVYP